ncbi:MAG: hypothetical protein WBX00_35675, partial [Isosphaeraceae bacterium]
PTPGSPAASGDNGPRTPACRSGSRGEWRAAAGLDLLVGAASGGVQAPGQDVGLDLPIPLLGQELLEPPREAVKLFGGQLGDGGLKFFDAQNRQATLACSEMARARLALGANCRLTITG